MTDFAFPPDAKFARTLKGMQLRPGEPTLQLPTLLVAQGKMATNRGRQEFHPRLHLLFPADGLTPTALVKASLRYLQNRNHLVNEEMCAAVLALVSLDPALQDDPVGVANMIFENHALADLSQFVILRDTPPPAWKTVEIGPFSWGHLNRERMRSRCAKAGSDFYFRCGHEFNNRFAIERHFRPVPVLNFVFAQQRFEGHPRVNELRDLWSAVLLEYFEQLSALQFTEFWEDLKRQQLVLAALGMPYFPDQNGISPDPWNISIYLNIGDRGYVCPTRSIAGLPWLGLDSKISLALQELSQKYGFSGLVDTNSIHRTIAIYAKFVERARTFADGKSSESLLHYVIALDLLLGGEGRSTASVAERSAVLTYRARSSDFERCCKEMKAAYDARSKYVHEGRECGDEHLQTLREACAEIISSLLRLSNGPESSNDDWHRRWQLRLDQMITSHKLGEVCTLDEITRCGISRGPQPSGDLQ